MTRPFQDGKERKALFEVVCIGQYNGLRRPTRAERKAAKWAGRVLQERKSSNLMWQR